MSILRFISSKGPHLEVWAGDTSGELLEKRALYLDKLLWMDNVQNLFNFPQIHHLLRAVGLWPET